MERQLFVSQENNLYGARDKDGNEKIPFKFNSIIEQDDYVYFGDCDRLLVNLCTGKSMSLEGFHFYYRKSGTEYMFDTDMDTKRGYFLLRTSQGEKYGVLDGDFNLLIPFEYDRISPADKRGIHKIEKNGRYGYADANYNIVAPCEYVTAQDYGDKYTLVSKCVVGGNKRINRENFAELCRYGCVGSTGHEVIPCVYDKLRLGAYIWAKKDGDYGLITDHNEEIIPFGKYSFLLHAIKEPDCISYPPEDYPTVVNCNVFIAADKDGNYGLIDAAQNVIAPFKYSWIKQFSYNHVTFETENGERSGLLDMKGREVAVLKNANFKQEFIYGYSIEGKDGMCGYVNAEMKQIVPCQYDTIEEEEVQTVLGDEHYKPLIKATSYPGGKLSFYNIEGNLIYANCQWYAANFDGEKFVIDICDKDKWGVYDFEGNCIKPCKYARQPKYEKVQVPTSYEWDNWSRRERLKDESGNVILSEYSDINDYNLRDGYAIVKKNDEDHYDVYDLRAKAVIPRKNCIDLEKTFMPEVQAESEQEEETPLSADARMEVINGETVFFATNAEEFEALLSKYPDYDEEEVYTVYIPKSAKEIANDAFSECCDLGDLIIEEGVKSIGSNAFFNCPNLQTVKIPSTVKTIGLGAFDWCKDIESIFIPKSVKSIGLCAFHHCDSLTEIIVEEGNPTYRTGCNAIIDNDNTVVATCKNTTLPDDLPNTTAELALRSIGTRMNYRFCEEADEELQFLLSYNDSDKKSVKRIQKMVLRELVAGKSYLLDGRCSYMWNVKPEYCTKKSLEGFSPKYSKMWEGKKLEGRITSILYRSSNLNDSIYAHTEEYAVVVRCKFSDILENIDDLSDKGNFVPRELRAYATSRPVPFLGGYKYVTHVTYREKEVKFMSEFSSTSAAEVYVYKRIKGARKFQMLTALDVIFPDSDLGEYLMENQG